jgi:hypothetical protein
MAAREAWVYYLREQGKGSPRSGPGASYAIALDSRKRTYWMFQSRPKAIFRGDGCCPQGSKRNP